MALVIRPKDRSGLTLVEILVVLTLIALLAALVGPRILGRASPATRTPPPTQTSWR
jgi:prepilin-type N-terminal cleavage/methylation domain-containing protein